MIQYAERLATWRTPAGNAAVFAYRDGTSDWNTITSCLTNDEYGLPRNMSGTGVDIGAHIGSVAIALALDNPAMTVIAVEPVPDNVRLLRENVARNGVAVTVVEAAAVGPATPVMTATATIRYGFTGSEAAEHHAFIGNSSLYVDGFHITERVPAFRLDYILGHADWLKIDIEGGEFDVLRDAQQVAIIVGEGHATHGTQADLRALLPDHDITFGPGDGAWGFRAVRR